MSKRLEELGDIMLKLSDVIELTKKASLPRASQKLRHIRKVVGHLLAELEKEVPKCK